MNSPFLGFLIFSIFLLAESKSIANIANGKDYVQCLTTKFLDFTYISEVTYSPKNSSFDSILNFSIQNLRFALPSTPKPAYIITPIDIAEMQAVLSCSRDHGYQVRIRSGGHDVEGLSYTSNVPFVVLDLIRFRNIDIDVENGTAWVQAGATIGELYYEIAKKSDSYGFPGGIYASLGVGGLISGGGYGALKRKFGLAADNVIDAQFMDKNGNLAMSIALTKDTFWAIRGGMASNFGIVHAWKLKLVRVPKTVTVFTVRRTLEQNGTNIFHRWQSVASKVDRNLYITAHVQGITQGGKNTMQFTFISMFLGGANKLISLIQKSFPELGLVKKDCSEMSWGKAALFLSGYGGFPKGESLEILLERAVWPKIPFKAKSDFVKVPIPVKGLEGIWKRFLQLECGVAGIQMSPYGGKMDEYAESALPFPHRAGNLYMMTIGVSWDINTTVATQNQRLDWLQSLYSYLTPYVSKNPRAAYVNINDLDLGNGTSYNEASKWGNRYFKNNFKRLVRIKTKLDPENFFSHEQSIPVLPSKN